MNGPAGSGSSLLFFPPNAKKWTKDEADSKNFSYICRAISRERTNIRRQRPTSLHATYPNKKPFFY